MDSFEILPIQTEYLFYISRIMQMRWDVSEEYATKDTKRYLAMNAESPGFCLHNKGEIVGECLEK